MWSFQQGRRKSKKHKKARRRGTLLQKLMAMADDEAPKDMAGRVPQGTVMKVRRRLLRIWGFDEAALKRSQIGIVEWKETG